MHLKNFAKNTSVKEVFLTSIGIIFGITILRSLGLLQSLELTAYDFLFYLRPNEPLDERIVIVTWDETDIQINQEGTISDNILATTLDKIRTQQPRIIALDLFRDVPVASYGLSKQQNQQAYQRVIGIFNSTPNLAGIEKVTPPKVNPPLALKEQGQTTAADLLEDVDGTIRRAYFYVYPGKDEDANGAGIFGLGAVLGIQYLRPEGFKVGQIESNDALTLTHPQTQSQVILNPLEKLDGAYIQEPSGLQFLVNWRKGKPQFSRVSVTDLVKGNVPPDIFHDKIVLIGNTSASGSDKHFLPIDRWQDFSISNGVEIHAQIASSIISAALDGRPLIKPIPEWSEYLILLTTVLGIALLGGIYRQLSPLPLYLITTASGVVVISLVVGSSLIAFIQGYWIPIVPSLLGSLVTPGIICLVIYINKIKQSNENFKLLIKDLNHSVQNSLRFIIERGKTAQSLSSTFSQSDNVPFLLAQLEENLGKSPFLVLQENLDALMLQTSELNRQRENSQQYFNVTYLGKNIFSLQPTALNEFIKTVVKQIITIKESQYDFSIKLEEHYDSQIQKVNIHPQSFEKVLENLIDNAYYAIKMKINKIPEHQGILSIKTKQDQNQIQIIIQDNGIGMSSAIVEKIFTPFQSFKARNKGQGLGLSIVKETMAYHKGNIEVQSTEGEGSKFILTLPEI